MKRTACFFGIVFSVFALAGCSSGVEHLFAPGQGRLSVSVGGAVDDGARTALPAVDLDSFSSFELLGKKYGGTEATLGTGSTLAELNAADMTVDEGIWSFTLKAVSGGATYRGVVSLQKIVAGENELSFVLSLFKLATEGSGRLSVSVAYPVSVGAGHRVALVEAGLYTAALPAEPIAGYGSESLAVHDTADGAITLGDTEIAAGETLPDGYERATYEKAAVAAGTYLVLFRFYADEEKTLVLGEWREYAGVAADLESTSHAVISSLEQVYTIEYDYGGGELTGSATAAGSYTRYSDAVPLLALGSVAKSGCLFGGWYADSACSGAAQTQVDSNSAGDKTFYAKWIPAVLYVSEDGADDERTGLDENEPLLTLAKTLAQIDVLSEAYQSEDNIWKIYVTGSVAGGATVSSALHAAKLTIAGARFDDEKGPQDELHGGGTMRVLSLENEIPVAIEKLVITRGKSSSGDGNGGGIRKSGAGALTLTDCTVTENEAAKSGGGIYLAGGTTTIGGTTLVSNNTAMAGDGGGVYTAAALVVQGGHITGNTVTKGSTDFGRGGGVYVNPSGTFTLAAARGGITDNTASGYGGGVCVFGTFTMEDGALTGNTSASNGGGVCVVGDATYTLKGGTVHSNKTTTGNGGGVYVSGRFIMQGGEIGSFSDDSTLANTAASNGGGVYLRTGQCTQSGGVIHGNTALEGAGVYVYSGTFAMSDTAEVSLNTANGNGGGVYLATSGTLSMGGGNISGNTAGLGGGVYTAGTTYLYGSAVIGDASVLTATAPVAATADAHANMSTGDLGGAGLYNDGGKVYLGYRAYTSETENEPQELTGGIVFNYANAQNGGGICNASDGSVVMHSGTIGYNRADARGGALFNSHATFVLHGGSIIGNVAGGDGGAVLNGYDATITMTGGKISQNTSSGNGGGVLNNGNDTNKGMFTMTGGEISLNTADGNGGGVYNAGSLTLTGDTTKISLNTASTNGGGVYLANPGTFTMSGGEISLNTAETSGDTEKGKGAGVYVDSGTFTMSGGKINGNTASTSGGGVYLKNGNTFTMSGGEINLNTAIANGGGVYNAGTMYAYGTAVIGDSTRTTTATDTSYANKAGNIGGGIYNSGTVSFGFKNATLTGGLYGNYASGSGGGLYAAGTSKTLIASGNIIANATKRYGGGIYTLGSASVTMTDGTISKNHAFVNGGGIYKSGDGTNNLFRMTGGTVSENTATEKGSGVDLYNGAFEIGGSALIAKNNFLYIDFGGTTNIKLSVYSSLDKSAVATIALADAYYTADRVILNGTPQLLASEHEKFTMENTGWKIGADGRLQSATTPSVPANGGTVGDQACTTTEQVAEAIKTVTGDATVSLGSNTTASDFAKIHQAIWEAPANARLTLDLSGLTLEEIPAEAFANCNESIVAVKLPATLKKIGEGAFINATRLTSIQFPASLEEIGKQAFANCNKIATIQLPATLKKIGEEAFKNATGLTSIRFPASLEEIGKEAFIGTQLTSAEFEDTSATWTANGSSVGDITDTELNAFLLRANWSESVTRTGLAGYAWYNATRIHVGSAGSDSTGTGTSLSPYATIEKAIAAINSIADTSFDAAISVNGTIVGTTTISSLTAQSLTIEKDSSASAAVLDGNAQGTVLAISVDVPITLKDLTIQNGSASYGGG